MYIILCQAGNRKYFLGLFLTHVSFGKGSGKRLEMFLLRKR